MQCGTSPSSKAPNVTKKHVLPAVEQELKNNLQRHVLYPVASNEIGIRAINKSVDRDVTFAQTNDSEGLIEM